MSDDQIQKTQRAGEPVIRVLLVDDDAQQFREPRQWDVPVAVHL